MAIEDEIREIEEELKKTSYNKATQHHIGKLKAKIAKLREDIIKRASKKSHHGGYSVKKTGDATVVLVGAPSVGKSTLLNKLTNATSEVAAYDFTTLDVIPGVMDIYGAKIQLVDVPGLIEGAASGKGRGREVISVVRSADMIVLLTTVFEVERVKAIEEELYNAGVRLNLKPPEVKIVKQDRGGIRISKTPNVRLDDSLIKTVLGEYKIHNADIIIREDLGIDRLIDAILTNRIYVPSLRIINKIDLIDSRELEQFKALPNSVLISAETGKGLEELRHKIFESLGFIRIYMKPPGKRADLEKPLIIKSGATVADVTDKIHREFRRNFRYARVWGNSAKHEGQRIGPTHRLVDEDILMIVS